MNKEAVNYVIEKSRELMEADHCCQGAKDAAQSWLYAVGTERQAEETKKYIAELEGDIMLIDDVITLLHNPKAIKYFGEEVAAAALKQSEEIKANGGKYCGCEACTVAQLIVAKKDELI